MHSFSQRLTRRIVIALMLTLALVTFFAGVLNLDTGHLRYCNAGHKAPIVDGQPLPVDSNLPIGTISDWEYTTQEINLAPGSTVFLYTDGLDEAEDAGRGMFGKERIYEVMQTASQPPPARSSNG